MLKLELEDKWRDDVPVYDFFTGAEAKRFHAIMKSQFNRSEKSVIRFQEELEAHTKPSGIQQHTIVKRIKANINRNIVKRDAAKFRIDKIEAAIKDWFAE